MTFVCILTKFSIVLSFEIVFETSSDVDGVFLRCFDDLEDFELSSYSLEINLTPSFRGGQNRPIFIYFSKNNRVPIKLQSSRDHLKTANLILDSAAVVPDF